MQIVAPLLWLLDVAARVIGWLKWVAVAAAVLTCLLFICVFLMNAAARERDQLPFDDDPPEGTPRGPTPPDAG